MRLYQYRYLKHMLENVIDRVDKFTNASNVTRDEFTKDLLLMAHIARGILPNLEMMSIRDESNPMLNHED